MNSPQAYYNEIDPKAAAWLRELIKRDLIAPGIVDERDIRDVLPNELSGYTQCHFFAGVGGWSYSLRQAGWPDHKPIWTGSCPCPPFSTAGKQQRCPECGSKNNLCHPCKTGHFICRDCGCDRHADDRHVFPEFQRLIDECNPPIVLGEQVASPDGRLWLDVVSASLENASYGFVGADLCAAGVGSPNIRQRLYWGAIRMGDSEREGLERYRRHEDNRDQSRRFDTNAVGSIAATGAIGGVANDAEPGFQRWPKQTRSGGISPREQPKRFCDASRLDNSKRLGRNSRGEDYRENVGNLTNAADCSVEEQSMPSPTNGFWADVDWLFCTDGKWRPAKSSIFPLVDGISKGMVRGGDNSASIDAENTPEARVMRLKGYGNAINIEQAAGFIGAVADILPTSPSGGA